MAGINGVDFDDLDGINGLIKGEKSPTPTISVSGGLFGSVSVRVTNASSYTNPNFTVSADVSGTTTVSKGNAIKTLSSSKTTLSDSLVINDTSTTTGQRTVRVTAQEFGDYTESDEVTATYDVSFINAQYIRIRGVTSAGADSSARLAISDLRFYTAQGQVYNQGSPRYPATNLTSNTSENGIEVSQGHIYSTSYDAWKACNSNLFDLAWTLGTNATNNWWQLRFVVAKGAFSSSTVPTIKSMHIKFHSQNDAQYFMIQTSDTGAFAGEETDEGIIAITAEDTQLNFG